MPQEVFIPSKNKTLTFADDFTEQEIGEYIDQNFPRTGEDVAYDLKNRLLDPSWNPTYDDFEKLRSYNKSKDIDTAEVVGSIFDGAVQMGKNLLKAIPAVASDPASVPGSLVRGLVNNIKNYEILAQGGTNTGTPLFELMNGDSATAYSTWRDSINAARSLHETSNAAIAGMPVNPQQVAAAEIVADPMNLVPVVGMGGKAGAVAAKAVGAAGQLAERAGKAAVRAATYPERLLAGAAEKLAGVPANVAERTAADLATKAAVVDVATDLIPGATEIAATKAAGRGVAAAGEAVAAAAGEAVGGAGMLSSVEKAAMNPNLSTGARAILNVTARLIPRDAALVASQAAEAGLIGAAIGGGLGYLQSREEEEIGQAIGGGFAAGTIIGGGLKLYDVASGKVAKERVFNDAARNIAKAAAAGESEADLGFRADLFSKLGESDRKGNNLGTFLVMEDLINQRGGKVKVVDGEVVKGPGGETGWNAYYDPNDKTIYINRSGADATTLPHETVHAFLTDVLADELTGRLFAKDAEGRLQQTAPDGAIAGLIEGYLKDADNITRPDGSTEGQRLRERLDAAFDPATPISEQVSRLRDITHEIAARYAEQWVTKQNPRNFLTGAMPTIWSEAVNVARGKLDKLFGRETGNPVLDPTLKRIFSPKESGVPDRVGVPLDPRVLTQDFSDKKGKFMAKKGDAKEELHWNPVWAKVEPILAQGGASKPLNARFEKKNLSLRGVGDDVIDGLARTNIETPLKSSGPILSAQEAAYTKMAIRAMQTGELLQGNNYMSFLKDGQAESGVVRNGNPLDKRFAVIDVLWNKDNGVQILAVDIGSALNKLAADVRSKGSASGFDSIAQANKALNQYLRHVADSENNFDAAKKGWEIEVDGKPIGKTAHKTLHEALNLPSPKDKIPYRPDINIQRGGINRTSGVEFIFPRRITGNLAQTGVVTPISNKGVEAIQLRFQPQRTKVEQMPKGMIAQDADGARIVKTDTSGYRLFDPIGNRIGVFSTLEKAAEAATAQAGKDLATVKEIQYAIQEQRAKEVSVRQRASYREAVRQGDTQGQEAAGARQEEEGQVRFQPKRKKQKPLPRTPFEMGEQIAKREKGMAESAQRRTDRDVAALKARLGAEGTASQAEAAIAQDIAARRLQEDAALFAKQKKAPVSDEQLTAIREAGVAETYVKALLDFEDAYTKLTGEEPVGKSYRNEMMKMTDRQKDAILRLALSSDLPQAKLAIEVAREAADPAMRTAIERMFYAQEYGALWQEELTAQQSGASRQKTQSEATAEYGVNRLRERLAISGDITPSTPNRPLGPGVGDLVYGRRDSMAQARAVEAAQRTQTREAQGQLRQSVEQLMEPAAQQQGVAYGVNPNRAVFEAIAQAGSQPSTPPAPQTRGDTLRLRKAARAEAAQIAAEREAKLAQVEESATQAAAALSEEMAQRFKKIEAEIAKAEEVVTAEQEPIRKDRIILKLNGKYRLYGATAGLIGVFRNREDAIKKAKK